MEVCNEGEEAGAALSKIGSTAVQAEDSGKLTFSPSSLCRRSHAQSSAMSEECGRAVEKMSGRAKLIRKVRIVGEHSRTANIVINSLLAYE